jgi:hypothetical protein
MSASLLGPHAGSCLCWGQDELATWSCRVRQAAVQCRERSIKQLGDRDVPSPDHLGDFISSGIDRLPERAGNTTDRSENISALYRLSGSGPTLPRIQARGVHGVAVVRRPNRPHPLTQARNPSRQLGYRGSQPSSFLAFSFEDPRELVIWATTNSPAGSRPSQAGSRSGGLAPATWAAWRFPVKTRHHPNL